MSRAVLKGKTVFECDEDSRAALDYRTLTDEFLIRFALLDPFCNKQLIKNPMEGISSILETKLQ